MKQHDSKGHLWSKLSKTAVGKIKSDTVILVSSFLLNTHDEQGVALSAGLCTVPGGGFHHGAALAPRVFSRPSAHLGNMQQKRFIFSFGKPTSQTSGEHFSQTNIIIGLQIPKPTLNIFFGQKSV